MVGSRLLSSAGLQLASVAGVWKDFTFKMLTTGDQDMVAKHVREHFLRFETLNVLLGWSEENGKDHDAMVAIALRHGLSFGVFKTNTLALVGINLILNGQESGLEELTPKSDIAKKIFHFLEKTEEAQELASKNNFDANNFAEMFITSVDNRFGGQGIATEMYRRTLVLLKETGFKAVKSGFTSPSTRAIGAKLGFSETARVYLRGHVGQNGEKTFPNADEDQFVQKVGLML